MENEGPERKRPQTSLSRRAFQNRILEAFFSRVLRRFLGERIQWNILSEGGRTRNCTVHWVFCCIPLALSSLVRYLPVYPWIIGNAHVTLDGP